MESRMLLETGSRASRVGEPYARGRAGSATGARATSGAAAGAGAEDAAAVSKISMPPTMAWSLLAAKSSTMLPEGEDVALKVAVAAF